MNKIFSHFVNLIERNYPVADCIHIVFMVRVRMVLEIEVRTLSYKGAEILTLSVFFFLRRKNTDNVSIFSLG